MPKTNAAKLGAKKYVDLLLCAITVEPGAIDSEAKLMLTEKWFGALIDIPARRKFASLNFITSRSDFFSRFTTNEDAYPAIEFIETIADNIDFNDIDGNSYKITMFLQNLDIGSLIRLNPGYKELTSRQRLGRNFHICMTQVVLCEIARRKAWSLSFRDDLSRWTSRLSYFISLMASFDYSTRATERILASSKERNTAPVEAILVHGTWAAPGKSLILRKRKIGWYDPEHNFRKKIEEQLSNNNVMANFTSFHWSGANSLAARFHAAVRLSEIITNKIETGCGKIVLIGHSHGGNVILLAIDKLLSQKSLNKNDLDKLEVITLATPFIQVVDYPLNFKFISSVFCWIPISYFLIKISYDVGVLQAIYRVFSLDFRDFASWLIALRIISLSALIATITGITFYKIVHSAYFLIIDSSRVGDIRQVTRNLSWWANYTVPDNLKVKIIRGVSDEADLALGAGAIASRLSIFLNNFIIGQFVVLLFLLVLIKMFFIFFGLFIDTSKYSNEISLEVLWDLIMFVGVPIAFTTRISAMSLKLVYGKELFFAPPRCEIDTSGIPDLNENGTITTLRPNQNTEGLNHSIYDQPLCAELVADYIAAHAISMKNSGKNNCQQLHKTNPGSQTYIYDSPWFFRINIPAARLEMPIKPPPAPTSIPS